MNVGLYGIFLIEKTILFLFLSRYNEMVRSRAEPMVNSVPHTKEVRHIAYLELI